ncbi:MAG TPA: S8 family serine peptidase [Atopostipes sp.]|nr:S8 family serine peptidase [Atopostipes sp.]
MNKQNKFMRQLLVAIMLFIVTTPLFSNHLFNHPSFYNEQTPLLSELKEKTALPVVHAEEPTKVPGTTEEEFTPNTSNLHPQWNHNIMNIGQAWADGYTGTGISIAVLDTGFFIQHPDSSIVGGYSVFSDDPWSNDHSGHGTHIAGIISAKRGSPYQGIAPDAEVFGIKIYHEDDVDENGGVSTSVRSVVSGIEHAMEIGTDIIVISSGLSYHDPELYNVVKEAYDQGIMIIAASGNGKQTVNYPANYSEVIAVTAIDEQLNPALDIIYGQENDFSAPGVNIGGLSIPDSTYSYPYIFMSGSSQAAPHAAGLAAILMQKHGTRGEEIRKIMQEQALDIGDPGLFGHGLLQYVSEEDDKNNELVPPEKAEPESEPEEVEPAPVEDDVEMENGEREQQARDRAREQEQQQEEQEELRKPASSREADVEEVVAGEELVEFYQTDIIPGETLGTLENNILALVEDRGTLQINMNNMESLFLTENQVSQIRHRNIAIVLAKNDVTWTVPPANLVPGEATFRFYEGVPVGVNSHDGSSKGLHTIAIYQQGTRHDAYPSSMKISYNMDSFSMEQLLSLSACYWSKKEGKWVDVESNIEGREIALHTNHTTAVGFIDRKLLAQAAEDERTENEEMTVEEEAEEGFLSTIYGKVIVGVVIFVLLLIGVRIIIKKQSTQRG